MTLGSTERASPGLELTGRDVAGGSRTRAARRSEPAFGKELFAFLRDLKEHNDRDWFAANKNRYEEAVREPALAFVEDFAPHLEEISEHLRADARRSGGSLFRIHRDIRFSKDKTPYKTSIGIHFRHEAAADAHAPGLYLHLEPGSVFVGGGIWHPDSKATLKIREAIVRDPDAWTEATRTAPFAGALELGGEQLKRAPSGFDAEHPLIEDVRRKDFFGSAELSERDALAGGFIERYAELGRAASPLLAFLCRALELRF